jgi:hypothetical protein
MRIAGTTRRQGVVDNDIGSRVGTGIAECDRERDRISDIGRRIVDHLGQRQVGPLRRLGGAAAVIARIGVELVGVADGGRVGRANEPTTVA